MTGSAPLPRAAFDTLMRSLACPAAIIDADGAVVSWSDSFADIAGATLDALRSTNIDALLNPQDTTALHHHLANGTGALDITLLRARGPVPMSVSALPVDGDAPFFLCQATGAAATAQHQDDAEQDLHILRTTNTLKLAVEASGMGIWEYTPDTGQVHWDDRLLEIYGRAGEPNMRSEDLWETYIHPDDLEATLAYANECRRTNSDFCRDFRIIRPDGEVRHVRSVARFVPAPKGAGKLIGVNIDVTEDYARTEELERAQRQLEYDSRHDALTGLANRRKFDEVSTAHFDAMARTDRSAVMHLDLDLFKQINDTLGHGFGDAVLETTAQRLVKIIGERGIVSRAGGDEFVILLFDAPGRAELESLCETLISRCQQPVHHDGQNCTVGVSIGVAITLGPPRNPSKLFANADAALYTAKEQGRSRFRFFDAEVRTRTERETTLRQDLVDGLVRGEITCHFQPQYDAETLDIIGTEALVRWNSPSRGILSPADFMPHARKAGLVARIDAQVFRHVIAAQSRWAAQGLNFPVVALNISMERLLGDGLVEEVRWLLQDHHRISFELLETAFLDESEPKLLRRLDRLRQLGIGIELDDFGSGHSSVVALQTVRPDRVKIDQRLVDPICTDPNQLLVLQSLTKIARLNGAQVIVEGMETGIHLAAIRNVDCDALQGFALTYPMPSDEFAALLRDSGYCVAN
ncbi:PAS domain S-box-containing protein/diguanylate cyclase (GGDEF)-like protein [Litoreibacter ponti]|uniref:PAS domain S-box-containing protein/diguanylate cyclase (GGDEF)-like protein n=1 Tax=Litoreibacter ponti TaxID=1510457 RepID=A0A2T6BFE2_9RHOB|nr:GGDEF and EAL domain-containing protein [Litoreibacter ponti]PTX54778.1 PAS domain S-box-containing protein/diguanylate cyclase (GGDEF)-like protein [Litoreibacter ponti]